MSATTLLHGDALTVLRTLPDGAARCCVTSPPYFGLRDYGVEGQIGLEPTPDAYVARLVEVFREVRRVLRDDGTLWLNLGDSYAAARGGTTPPAETLAGGANGWMPDGSRTNRSRRDGYNPSRDARAIGLKHKDLIGIPWRVAFALQADGWYLRSDIIWHKPNPMPESVRDRPTKAHEYLFLLSKAERYFYDADAIAEPAVGTTLHDLTVQGYTAPGQTPQSGSRKQDGHGRRHAGFSNAGIPPAIESGVPPTRNARSVWTIATKPYKGAHFATMPPALAERCVLAGSAPGDTVLDPFGGSGTTAAVATAHARAALHIDLNPAYHDLAADRIGPMLCEQVAV